MEEQSALLVNVSVALGVALVGGWLATRLRLSSIIGYLAAGMVISPFTPGFVADVDALRLLADVGIVLLLFAIGVQFSLSENREESKRCKIRIVISMHSPTLIPLGAHQLCRRGAAGSRNTASPRTLRCHAI